MIENKEKAGNFSMKDNKIKALQRKAPSALISVRVNEYYRVSERLYIMLLGVKPLYEQSLVQVPARARAKKSGYSANSIE